ncbi:MAG: DUF1841 family protein [Gammaproteobacteria bacterium]|nr:DUF1841 family protein [Gammaproteobacteria bacterium]MCF6230311.1 DUF1841 family protein [Gammaproteobacteria bacterium]
MFFSQDRKQLRKGFFDAWEKQQQQLPLTPLEEIITGVIKMHPEYQKLIAQKNQHAEREYPPELGETNPFLHMAMHIALHEQISTDRPAGIRDVARQLLEKKKVAHDAEHLMMEQLAEEMWRSQRYNVLPDEQAYLAQLQELARQL